MKKAVLLVIIGIVIVGAIIAFVVVFANGNTGDVITQKETAIKIGRALLEERFPDSYLNGDEPLGAKLDNGIWEVYDVVEREGVTEDGQRWVMMGGVLYVKFRQDNGKVLEFGIYD